MPVFLEIKFLLVY